MALKASLSAANPSKPIDSALSACDMKRKTMPYFRASGQHDANEAIADIELAGLGLQRQGEPFS
jgi:hypothetical protein